MGVIGIPARSSEFIRTTRGLTPAARLLIINYFVMCLAFFMVLPFLAGYLRDDLGLATALAGLVLGIRTLSQQGLYLIGGSAADRLGPQRMIIAGCALRVVGFALFALTPSLLGIIAGTVLTGVAGALFSPAVTTYLTHESAGRRAETFALFNMAGNAGTLIGPVVGALLLAVDFRLVSGIAAAIFALLTVAQALVLPYRAPEHQHSGVLRSWWEVAANRRFLAFTLAGSAYFALFNQLYLALPLEAERVTGHTSAVSAVFIVSTVVGIAFSVRLTAACRRRYSVGHSMALGLFLMGAGFAPPALAAPLLATAPQSMDPPVALAAGLPVLLGTVLFSLGTAIAHPFMMELIPVVGSERLVGTYFGYFYLISALVTAALSAAAGRLLDLSAPTLRWTPFALLLGVGVAGCLLSAIMQRRGLLAPAQRVATEPAARP